MSTFPSIPQHDDESSKSKRVNIIRMTPRSPDSKCCSCYCVPIIHPSGNLKFFWDALVMILVIFTLLSIPYKLTFDLETNEASFPSPFDLIHLIIDIFLMIDILMNFRTAFYDELELIHDPSIIAMRYLRSWFMIDLFTSFPLQFISVSLSMQATYPYIILYCIKLLRIFRLIRIIKNYESYLTENEWIERFSVHLKLTKVTLFVLVCQHLAACLWFVVGYHTMETIEGSWISEHITNDSDELLNIASFSLYSTSWYLGTIKSMATIGNVAEQWSIYLIIIMKWAFIAYYISLLIQLVIERENKDAPQREKIASAKAYVKHYKFPAPIADAIVTETKYDWKYNTVRNGNMDIMNSLPNYLRRNVGEYMSEMLLNQLDIFKDLNAYIHGLIALKLKSVSCADDEYLFREDEPGKSMYIQRTGTSLITNRFNDECNVSKKGTVFGYFSFIKEQRVCSVKTTSYSEFYSLDYNDIINVLMSEFPKTWTKFWSLITKQIQILYDKQQIYLQLDTASLSQSFASEPSGKCNICKIKTKRAFNQWFNIKGNEDKEINGDIDYEKEVILMRKQTEKRRESLTDLSKTNILSHEGNDDDDDDDNNNHDNNSYIMHNGGGMRSITIKIEEQKQEKEEEEEEEEKCKKPEKREKLEKIEEETKQNENEIIDDNKTDKKEVELTKIEDLKIDIQQNENNKLMVPPKQTKKKKKKKKKSGIGKKKKKHVDLNNISLTPINDNQNGTLLIQRDDYSSSSASSSSMFGENSLNSLSHSIINGDDDDHDNDDDEEEDNDNLAPLLLSDDNVEKVTRARKYSLIESQTKSD